MTTTTEYVTRRPQYIEEREQLLLDQIFGTPNADGTFTGGLIDADAYPELFTIPQYRQATRDPLETSVTGMLGTTAQQEDFLNRYQPYFIDDEGTPRYLPEAGAAMSGGLGSIEDAAEYFPKAQTAISEGLGTFDPSQGSAVQNFMNPYQQQVVDASMMQIDREGEKARQRGAAQAVNAGAFGGSREGIQRAETERAIAEEKNKTIANLMSSGYTQALSGAMTADEAAMKRQLEGGRLYGGLGQALSEVGGAQADVGSQYGSLAGTGADIGRVYSALAPADMNFMYTMGGAERTYDQQGIDIGRQEAMRGTEQALMPYNYSYGALSGTPSASMSNQYTTNPTYTANPFISGIGAYTALQGVNQQRTG